MSIKGLYLFQYLLLGTGAFTFSLYDGFSSSLHALYISQAGAKKRVIPPLPAGSLVGVKGNRICSKV